MIYIAICLCVAYFGRNRSLGFIGFFLISLLLFPIGPFVSLIILFLTKEKRHKIVLAQGPASEPIEFIDERGRRWARVN